VFFVLCLAIYNCFFHPIVHLPGPLLARCSPLWTMFALHRKRFNSELQDLHTKYGPVVRIGPNEVSFATIEAQTTIYGTRPGQAEDHFSKDGTFLTLFSDLVLNAPTLITIADPGLHKHLRKILQQAFTPQALAEIESIQHVHLEKLMPTFDRLAKEGEVFDIALVLEEFFWDIIGDWSFGEPLLSGRKPMYESLKGLGKRTMPFVELLSYVTIMPGVNNVVRHALAMIPFQSQLQSKLLSKARLRDCMDRQDGRKDFLTAIMSSKDQGLTLNSEATLSNAVGLTLAGYQTTATTLSSIFYQLLRCPKNLHKLQTELRTTFSSASSIRHDRLLQLPFLNACIKETLRLLPPANGKTAQRAAPSGVIGDTYIPAGTLVSSDIYSIQRSPLYWADPEEFRPERWIENGPGEKYEMDVRQAYRPFLIGTRSCIGRKMAMQSLRCVTARLVWGFDVEMARGEGEGWVWERDAGSSLIYTDYRVLVSMRPRSVDES
ncbi:putative cytochrome P450, partial [Wilcoxina mikolae CBS 423.85]